MGDDRMARTDCLKRLSQSPMYQLALTFAALQLSNSVTYDPSGLVDALMLEKGNQQDASE
jgi:ubiquitin carboxyl-terminal hydrolase 48